MKTVITDDEIYEKVRQIVANALGVEEEEVTPEARLTDDLGAESIDFLDIFFQVDKTFGVKIDAHEKIMNTVANDDRFVQGGTITDAGMEELRRQLPGIDLESLEQSRNMVDFLRTFTVDGVVRLTRAKLNECA